MRVCVLRLGPCAGLGFRVLGFRGFGWGLAGVGVRMGGVGWRGWGCRVEGLGPAQQR